MTAFPVVARKWRERPALFAKRIYFHSGLLWQRINLPVSFGTLDFHPVDGFKFWETAESLLEAKFVQAIHLADSVSFLIILHLKLGWLGEWYC